jgi:glucan phosphoethanolaminetransferase (alkaline phosphatase superfamily)
VPLAPGNLSPLGRDMARFLKIISGLHLVLVWFAFALVISVADARTAAEMFAAVFAAVSLSIPSAVLFAFAQIPEDVRSVRNNLRLQSHHLEVIRSHYEVLAMEAHLARERSASADKKQAKPKTRVKSDQPLPSHE